jgi:hypothetical protein
LYAGFGCGTGNKRLLISYRLKWELGKKLEYKKVGRNVVN